MNQRAAELGMKDTHFVNPCGLDADGHVTSAHDIALMSRQLLKNHPDIKKFTTIWMDTVRNGAFGLANTNKLVRFYKRANGMKTGFTSEAGYSLSGTALILIIVFTFRNMPVAIESGTTTLLQIDNSIEEASTILGADTGYSFRRITLPLLRNAFFSGLVYSFTKAITAVSAVIFLVSPKWNLVTSKIYTLFEQAKYSQAAAFVTMMVVILLVFIGIFDGAINMMTKTIRNIATG